MNDLSWFLYFADVLPKLEDVAGFALFASLLFLVVPLAVANVFVTDVLAPDIVRDTVRKSNKWVLGFVAVTFLVYIFIPSRETIYMIAGSEAGEYIVETPEAQEILDSIKEVIQLQIEELKPSDSKPAN